jgi:hypothetical protein
MIYVPGISIRLTADFSPETMEAKKEAFLSH